MWCGTKPIVAVALLAACERARVELETPLEAVAPDVHLGVRLSLGSILRHDAGLAQPLRVGPAFARERVVLGGDDEGRRQPGQIPGEERRGQRAARIVGRAEVVAIEVLHPLVGQRYWAACRNLFLEQGHHRAIRPQNVAKTNCAKALRGSA